MTEEEARQAWGDPLGPVLGITLRDYFAAAAIRAAYERASKFATGTSDPIIYDAVASDAYKIADAMLKERTK